MILTFTHPLLLVIRNTLDKGLEIPLLLIVGGAEYKSL